MRSDVSYDASKESEPNLPGTGEQPISAGPLAEFTALRQEIERRSNIQHNLFALQLTAAAVIFSFALSGTGRAELLLIIPISTFMLCGEYADQIYGMNNAARYINGELDPWVPGGLKWESWSHNPRNVDQRCLLRTVALMVAFPAVAIGALAWAAPNVLWSGYPLTKTHIVAGGVQAALITVWAIGVVASAFDIWIILRAQKPYQLSHCPQNVGATPNRSYPDKGD